MSVNFLYYKWWVGDDGHPWVRHECRSDGKVDVWRLPPPWKLDGAGGITPSLDCQRCGAHSILNATDRIDPPPRIESPESEKETNDG